MVGRSPSFLPTCFSFDYLPRFDASTFLSIRRVPLPVTDYAFQAIRHGRFPEWDPTIYCGLSFVGNIQAALFYPPTWLLFLTNFGTRRFRT